MEPIDPVPPFLSRAGSRVFSLSNMLRGSDTNSYLATGAGDFPAAGLSSKNYSQIPVDGSSVVPVMSSPGGFALSRATSKKGMQFC